MAETEKSEANPKPGSDPNAQNTETQADGGGGSGEFPPFNPDTFAPQLIWLAIVFVALYFMLSRIVLPRIGEVIEERSERIQRDYDAAERLKNETDEAIASYEQALADARAKASSIAAETKQKVNAEIKAERERVEKQLDEKLEAAEKRIAETRDEALAKVDDIATEVANDIVSQLTGANVSDDEIRSAVKSVRS